MNTAGVQKYQGVKYYEFLNLGVAIKCVFLLLSQVEKTVKFRVAPSRASAAGVLAAPFGYPINRLGAFNYSCGVGIFINGRR